MATVQPSRGLAANSPIRTMPPPDSVFRAKSRQQPGFKPIDAEDSLTPELRQRMDNLEAEYEELVQENDRMLANQGSRSISGGRPESPVRLSGRRSVTPKYLPTPSKGRNTSPQRSIDVELAQNIGYGLITEARVLRNSVVEKDDELKMTQEEKLKLEAEVERLRRKVRDMDESEQKYKDENWALETQLRGHKTFLKDAQSREQKLAQGQVRNEQSKLSLQRELDDLKVLVGTMNEDRATAKKRQEAELVELRRDYDEIDSDRVNLEKKLSELTTQHQDLASAFAARLRHDEAMLSLEVGNDLLDEPGEFDTFDASPPPSPSKAVARVTGLETETSKGLMQHQQRTLLHYKCIANREKSEKIELRRRLQEAQDELEIRLREAGQTGKPTKKRGTSERDAQKNARSATLGSSRTATEEVLADQDWEEHQPFEIDPPKARPLASANTRAKRYGLVARPASISDDTDAFETANEVSGTATDSDVFDTGVEVIEDDEGELTETEQTTRHETAGAGQRVTSRPFSVHRPSFHSTASGSDEEGESRTLATPKEQQGFTKWKNSRNGAFRRSRLTSGDTDDALTGIRDSPASFASTSTPGSFQPRSSRNLFEELDGLDGSEAGTPEGTPSRLNNLQKSSIGNSSTALSRTLPFRHDNRDSDVLPRIHLMQDAGTMTIAMDGPGLLHSDQAAGYSLHPTSVPHFIDSGQRNLMPVPGSRAMGGESSILSTPAVMPEITGPRSSERNVIHPDRTGLVPLSSSALSIQQRPTDAPPTDATIVHSTSVPITNEASDNLALGRSTYGEPFRGSVIRAPPSIDREAQTSLTSQRIDELLEMETVRSTMPLRADHDRSIIEDSHVTPSHSRNTTNDTLVESTHSRNATNDSLMGLGHSRNLTNDTVVITTPLATQRTPADQLVMPMGQQSRRSVGENPKLTSEAAPLAASANIINVTDDAPPVPAIPSNHQRALPSSRIPSQATVPDSSEGLMAPPAMSASAMRAIRLSRPKTPVEEAQKSPTFEPGTATVHLPRIRQPQPSIQSVARSDARGVGSRRSSVSSFASELDERYNIASDGLAMGGMYQGDSQTDPRMIQAITQTMIGEYLWKYVRKTGRGEMSKKRHRRFFWVHPYTRTLYWSDRDPTTAGKAQLSAKSVAIEGVRVVPDDNPMPPGLHRKSILIHTPGRSVQFTAGTSQRHETWYNALSFLLIRPQPAASTMNGRTHQLGNLGTNGQLFGRENDELAEFNPGYRGAMSGGASRYGQSRTSLAGGGDRGSRATSIRSGHAGAGATARRPGDSGVVGPPPALSSASRYASASTGADGNATLRQSVGNMFRPSTSMRSRRSRSVRSEATDRREAGDRVGTIGSKPPSVYETRGMASGSGGAAVGQPKGLAGSDSAEDVREMLYRQEREADGLENVRACCDGKCRLCQTPSLEIVSLPRPPSAANDIHAGQHDVGTAHINRDHRRRQTSRARSRTSISSTSQQRDAVDAYGVPVI